jgi:hypothetical protein
MTEGVRDATGFSSMAPRDIMDVLTYAAFNHLVSDDDRDSLLQHDYRVQSHGLNDGILRYLGVSTMLYAPGESQALRARNVPLAVPRVRIVTKRSVYERASDPPDKLPVWERPRTDTSDGDPPVLDELPAGVKLSSEMLELMADRRHDAAHSVMLDQEPDMPPLAENAPPVRGTAQIVEDEPEHVGITVQSSQQALLVLADAWSEGWWARVNGHPARVYPADGVMRAVVVPAGPSRVDFTYAPPAWVAGWQLSLLTAAIMLFLAVRDKVAPRPPSGTESQTTGREEVAEGAPAIVPEVGV